MSFFQRKLSDRRNSWSEKNKGGVSVVDDADLEQQRKQLEREQTHLELERMKIKQQKAELDKLAFIKAQELKEERKKLEMDRAKMQETSAKKKITDFVIWATESKRTFEELAELISFVNSDPKRYE
jgi:hypothetical protein